VGAGYTVATSPSYHCNETMNRTFALSLACLFGALVVPACTSAGPGPAATSATAAPVTSAPAASATATSTGHGCLPRQIVGPGGCYDTADTACAAIGCPRADCTIHETAPGRVHCKH